MFWLSGVEEAKEGRACVKKRSQGAEIAFLDNLLVLITVFNVIYLRLHGCYEQKSSIRGFFPETLKNHELQRSI